MNLERSSLNLKWSQFLLAYNLTSEMMNRNIKSILNMVIPHKTSVQECMKRQQNIHKKTLQSRFCPWISRRSFCVSKKFLCQNEMVMWTSHDWNRPLILFDSVEFGEGSATLVIWKMEEICTRTGTNWSLRNRINLDN